MSTWKTPAEGAPTYRILQREGCTIVYGHMPLGAWLRLLREASDLHVLHADVARMLAIVQTSFPSPPGFSIKLFQDARIGPKRQRLHARFA